MGLIPVFKAIRLWHWRRTYRPGRTVTRFLARDIRRDIEVIDIAKSAEGVITAKTCTWNVLYQLKNIQQKPAFGPLREIEIKRLWDWSGESWGGPVPAKSDDTV